jgi:site-specific recombinase
MIETHKRTLARIVTYRLLAVIFTAVWTGLSTAIGIHIGLMIIHYVHDRVWLKVKWGDN